MRECLANGQMALAKPYIILLDIYCYEFPVYDTTTTWAGITYTENNICPLPNNKLTVK